MQFGDNNTAFQAGVINGPVNNEFHHHSAPVNETSTSIVPVSDAGKNASLLQASRTGSLTSAKRLLENGADLHAYDEQLRTPLHLACLNGHVKLVKYFTETMKANVEEEDENLMQPLHLAAARGNGEITNILLNAGAPVNARDKDGFTALHHAAVCGDDWTIYFLMNKGGDPMQLNNDGLTPTRLARRNQNLTAFRRLQGLISGPPDANSQVSIPQRTGLTRRTPRMEEWMYSNFNVMYFDHDANIPQENTPLYVAASSNDLDTVENLLDEGNQPSARVLYKAAKEGYHTIVAVIVDLVPDINESGGFYGNSLCAAASSMRPWDSIKALRILLDKGAYVNWEGGHYGCALQAATANYRLEMVKMLLENGADANAQNGHYGNSLTAAARHGTHFSEMTQLLLDRGADIDAQGPGVYGNPLQTAVWLGYVNSVRFLLDRGANKWTKGRFGSALDIAWKGTRYEKRVNIEILDLLEPRRTVEEVPDVKTAEVQPGILGWFFGRG